MIKLNVGASPIWFKENWYTLDHKVRKNNKFSLEGTASNIPLEGKKVSINSMIVPGSGLVKQQAEKEGLDKILINAGFDWREPGCSMCLAMNPDQLKPKERCASTSNRNFEGRQGREGRTHLVSPTIAAATAIKGKLTLEEDI